MKYTWSELEKLSKDELIIELVKAKWEMRNLQKVILELSQSLGSFYLYEPGIEPSEEWQKKIAEYVFVDDDYHTLKDWGVDEKTADKLYDEYYDEDGKLKKKSWFSF